MEMLSISRIYSAVVGTHGPWVAIVSVLAVAIIYAGFRWLKILGDIKKSDAEDRKKARAREFDSNVAMVERDAVSREKERADLIEELSSTRKQMDARGDEHKDQIVSLIEKHFTHDKAEREIIAKTLIGVTSLQEALAEDLKSHRAEEGRRAERLYAKFEQIGKTMSNGFEWMKGHNA